jgi:hypothetical protein
MDYWASFLSDRGWWFGALVLGVILAIMVTAALGLFAVNLVAGTWR